MKVVVAVAGATKGMVTAAVAVVAVVAVIVGTDVAVTAAVLCSEDPRAGFDESVSAAAAVVAAVVAEVPQLVVVGGGGWERVDIASVSCDDA